jgi:uncharacterized protein (DUF433 family)
MNAKLVDSLVAMIDSLDDDDYKLLQDGLQHRLIQKTEGVCGGYARIRNTRIPIWTIISFLKQGATIQEILENYPILTLLDLTAVQSYYQTHSQEIDLLIASHHGDLIEC